MKEDLCPDIATQQYHGPKRPPMPKHQYIVKRDVKSLSRLAQEQLKKNTAAAADFEFLTNIVVAPSTTPEYGGFNTKLLRTLGKYPKPATKVRYIPLIDMVPSDPTTMKTAMVEAQKLTNRSGQGFTIFTADQQLYRVMVHILWAHPTAFRNFYPRLGGMHMLMSFVGCVGTLMSNSGLEDVLKSGFGGVAKMLTGKNFPQNVRALRMLLEEVLHRVIKESDSYSEMIDTLENRGEESRTSRLWIDCFIKPVLIAMQFVRAEREGDWQLHLCSASAMMPYFFAAGHINYARYGLFYLRQMEALPDDVRRHFDNGEHVMRHGPGIWNGMWSDMYIETTFMRYGHGPGGIIGITLNQAALKRWALSLHTCSQLIKDLVEMTDGKRDSSARHKEEMPSRILSDAKDRDAIREKLALCIDPLDPKQHPTSGIVNIVTGHISKKTNVDEAVSIGRKQMLDYEMTWPQGFHTPIPRKVVTLTAYRASTQQTQETWDTELIYSRVLGLMTTREFDLPGLFKHELAAMPTSLFDENGEMRIPKSKSTLKKKLHVEKKLQQVKEPSVTIIDGCAILWVISWPHNGTVEDFVEGFTSYVHNKLNFNDVYLVFDRYLPCSIKGSTRNMRAGERVSRCHKLALESPLPPQKVVLTAAENKMQIIELICNRLIEKVRTWETTNVLVVTGKDAVPLQVCGREVSERADLETHHEEADVILCHQAVSLAKRGTTCIKVISDDTDVFALLLHFYQASSLTCDLLMEGTSSGSKIIDIKETAAKHVDILSNLLQAHALSGCDTVAGHYGIGKGTVINELHKGHELGKLGDLEVDIEEVISQACLFMGACYRCKRSTSTTMSQLRYKTWLDKIGNKKVTAVPKLKTLPPTSEAFAENVKRAHLQTAIWKNALETHPPDIDPTSLGWSKHDDTTLLPVSLPDQVQLAPPEVLKLIRCGCTSEQACANNRCGCSAGRLPCTVFCSCRAKEECHNRWNNLSTEDEESC